MFYENKKQETTEIGESEYLLKGGSKVERIKRDTGDVTVLSLEENGRFRESPLGVLSSTARTFVQDGATTEFATQILGTTVGRTYARLLSTGSRVFYDNVKPLAPSSTKQNAFLVFPTVPGYISPTPTQSSQVHYQTAIPIPAPLLVNPLPKEKQPISYNEIYENPTEALRKPTDEEKDHATRKEYSSKRTGEVVKPAKVRPDAGLPTFTVKNEFSPSGFGLPDPPESRKIEDPKKPRGGKGLFRGGVQIKNDFQKFDTVTYVGFADFTTTVGSTVIIFTPKTSAQNTGAVTSISGEATLMPEHASGPIATTASSFISHSANTAINAFEDQILNSDRTSKAFIPPVSEEKTSTEREPEPPTETEPPLPTTLGEIETPGIPIEEAEPTEPAPVEIQPSETFSIESEQTETFATVTLATGIMQTETPGRFATTTTLIFNSEDQPLGLVKSIGGTEAFNGTTTLFTSFLYGTVLNGAYTQLTQTASSIFYAVDETIDPTAVIESSSGATDQLETTENIEIGEPTEEVLPTSEDEVAPKPVTEPINQDHIVELDETDLIQPTNQVTQIIPTTVYKTFTYLTTFFIPEENGQTSTSVRSREVVSDEVVYVTTVLANEELESAKSITPTEVQESFATQTSEDTVIPIQAGISTVETPESYETTEAPITTVQEIQEELTHRQETTPHTNVEVETSPREETSPVTTETPAVSQPQTTPARPDDKPETHQTPPQLPETTPELPETSPGFVPLQITTESNLDSSSTTEEGAKEVELIFKTVYTTYTYLTTFFQESTTSVKSREVVVTNVLTSTVDNESVLKATTPAVEGLFDREDSLVASDIAPTKTIPPTNPTTDAQATVYESSSSSVDIDNELYATPSLDSQNPELKTYTYFTTVLVDGETIIESRTEVLPVEPTNVNVEISTAISEENNVVPASDHHAEAPLKSGGPKKKPVYGTIYRPKNTDVPNAEAFVENNFESPLQSSIDDAYTYDTTMSRDHRTSTTPYVDETTLPESDIKAREEELKKEALLAIGVTSADNGEVFETMITDITSSSSGGSYKIYDEPESDPNDQISSESNTEEIEPSFSPTLLLQTSFTTFTYFTTVYRGSSSNVVSRLETVTNVVTETVKPTELEARLSPEEATLPITYFTTFTYWTTLYKGTKTMVTSREETVSNIVTPVLPSLPTTDSIQMTETTALPTEMEISPTEISMEPTTFYTTYTYFTTSYIANETVINSHLETETNIVTPTPTSTEVLPTIQPNATITESEISDNSTSTTTTSEETQDLKPTGLISSIQNSEVNEGTTTLLNTNIYGTYIDDNYAQVLESSTEIITPTPTPTKVIDVNPTGIVSLNEGRVVDADGISTVFYTTKAVGTYIENLYAQIIESTSSIQIDEAKRTLLPSEHPSVTVIGTKSYRTGLVRLIEGSIVKDGTTTFYESKVIGTITNDRYAQIIESTSSFKVDVTSTNVPEIAPTATTSASEEIVPTISSTSPSPDVIESSISDTSTETTDAGDTESEEGKDDGAGGGRVRSRLSFTAKKNTFTPVFRPFASRQRPTFLPKKKTGDLATIVSRPSFTPTVTATPASKTGFGASKNRFASNRKPSTSSVLEIKPTSAGSRRFSRPRSTSGGFSSAGYRGRTSAGRIQPTVSSSPTSRRGGFNYRTSAPARFSSANPTSRPRIRPTLSSAGGRFFATATNSVDDVNSNDIGGTTAVTEDSELFSEEDEREPPTTVPSTTTESARRNNNPLLRFRRPPILQRQFTTTTTNKPTTAQPTPKKNNLLRRPDNRSPQAGGGPKARPASPVITARPRPRPVNNLFPPRSLLRKPSPADEAEEKEEDEKKEEELEEDDEIEDNEYEGSETSELQSSTTTEAAKSDRRGKAFNVVQIRPFARRPRAKRQADFGTRSYTSRYRRPTPKKTSIDYPDEPTKSVETQRQGRYNGRSRNTQRQQKQQETTQQQQPQPRVRPSPVNNAPRPQFTLRERSQTTASPRSNFRRPSSPSRRRGSSEAPPVQRPKAPRLKSQSTQSEATTFTRQNSGRKYNTRRPSSRSRSREAVTDLDTYTFSLSSFDGTITVTHKIPTEVTIPIINGKNTEYKNVITAKPSLETLGPHQYSTVAGKDGKPIIQLTSEITSTQPNGVVEITKFLVYETPTTSITFTPTLLRGRKTSFSHVIPSTVYDVVPEVSTVQPKLAANAPLANLLLSQLLLGNLGLQNTLNPLIGLNQPQVEATPITEFKTKTTTYVTTVTDHTSTVIPITFRGKPIQTTILDSSSRVITATEYITETVVTTPTPVPAINNQLNTLLLPALLQAQLLGQQQQPAVNPLLGTLQQLQNEQLNIQDKLIEDEPEQRFISRRRNNDDDEANFRDSDSLLDLDRSSAEHKSRKKAKIKVKHKADDLRHEETSLVTLYVSGKHPGEFSTVVSTVTLGDESSIRKREVKYAVPELNEYRVQISKTPELGGSFSDATDYITAAINDVDIESSEIETQSLESIIGDVSRFVTIEKSLNTGLAESYSHPSLTVNNHKSTGHFLLKSPAESAPDQRIGTPRSDNNVRVKRQAPEQTQLAKRRRVRVRVPVHRHSTDVDQLATSESQTEHEFRPQTISSPTEKTEFGRRKVKVIRKKITPEETTTENNNKVRIAVKRRRITDNRNTMPILHENSRGEETQKAANGTLGKRKRILVSRKRVIAPQTSSSGHKRRIIVTKKRPSPTRAMDENFENMSTVYQFQYNIPSEASGIEGNVKVSQMFLSDQIPTSHADDFDTAYSPNSDLGSLEPSVDIVNDAAVSFSPTPYISTIIKSSDFAKEHKTTEFSTTNIYDDQTTTSENKGHFTNTKFKKPSLSKPSFRSINFNSGSQEQILDSSPTTYAPHRSLIRRRKPTKVKHIIQESQLFNTPPHILEDRPPIEFDPDIADTASEPPISENPFEEKKIANEFGGLPKPVSTAAEAPDDNISERTTFQPHLETQTSEVTDQSDATTASIPFWEMDEIPPVEISDHEILTNNGESTVRNEAVTSKALNEVSTEPVFHEPEVETANNPQGSTTEKKVISDDRNEQSTTVKSMDEFYEYGSEDREENTTPNNNNNENQEDDKVSINEPETDKTREVDDVKEAVSEVVPTVDHVESDDVRKFESSYESQAVPVTVTKTLTTTRLRTFTYIVTRVSADEQFITSSTTVRPDIKTLVVTELLPASNNPASLVHVSIGLENALPSRRWKDNHLGSNPAKSVFTRNHLRIKLTSGDIVRRKYPHGTVLGSGRLGIEFNFLVRGIIYTCDDLRSDCTVGGFEGRARHGLATKVMSNGVEVIVAASQNQPQPTTGTVRILPTAPITLPPTTVTDHMLMLLPQESQKPHNEFVTKTYMTTYTYMTTFSEGGSTAVSSRERTVTNVITEEIQPSRTQPPPGEVTNHVTLTASPELTTGVYRTTYTYLNTLVDGELPLVVTSKKTVANTITEPPTLIQPSEVPVHDTNTYLSTVAFTRTLTDGERMKLISTKDVLTQVVITQSDYMPSKMEIKPTATTTDVTKTYFVTYTYYNTMLENGSTVVKSQVATSSDVVTETFTIRPTRTQQVHSSTKVSTNIQDGGQELSDPNKLLATKTYQTTFTYFTTLLQDSKTPSIIVKSRTKVVQNVVTEKVDTGSLETEYMNLLHTSAHKSPEPLSQSNEASKSQITPTKTTIVSPTTSLSPSVDDSSSNNVIKGSTIIYFDDEDQVDEINLLTKTSSLKRTTSQTTVSVTPSATTPLKNIPEFTATVLPPSTPPPDPPQDVKVPSVNNIPVADNQLPPGVVGVTHHEDHVNNLLHFGSLGINGLSALGPVFNAMAGLIQNNLIADKNKTETASKPSASPLIQYANGPARPPVSTPAIRSPIYIPVGGIGTSDSEASESQKVEGLNTFPDTNERTKPYSPGPNIEAALISGGIPISPGQVITTNSDVIIGKPGVHGPRPPVKQLKNDEVQGMKPPPLPGKPPFWPVRDQSRFPSVIIPHRIPPDYNPHLFKPLKDNDHHQGHKHQNPHKNVNYQNDFRTEHFGNNPKIPLDHVGTYNNPLANKNIFDEKEGTVQQNPHYIEMPNKNKFIFPNGGKISGHHFENPTKFHSINNQKFPGVFDNHFSGGDVPIDNPLIGVHHTGHIHHQLHNPLPPRVHYHETPDLRPPSIPLIPPKTYHRENNVPSVATNDPGNYSVSNEIPSNQNSYHGEQPPPPHPLLVNIQPSQVANVIIPHGSATAVIFKDEPDKHSQKGEIFNDPSPYPDAEVGMVGVAGLSTSDDGPHQAAHVPSNAVLVDIQVSPHLAHPFNKPSGFKTPLHGHVLHDNTNQNRPPNYPHEDNTRIDYLSPPHLPTSSLTVSDPSYGEDSAENQSEDYLLNDQLETEGGEVIQESKTRPLRPGQLPIELLKKPVTSMPLDVKEDVYFDVKVTTRKPESVYTDLNYSSPLGDIKYSVVNSKPVKLDSQNSNINHPPIINGKPAVNPFSDSSQATVSIGHKTELKPNVDDRIHSGIPKFEQESPTFPPKNRDDTENSTSGAPFDNTIATMNIDERPPLPTFETPSQSVNYETPLINLVGGSSPRPFSKQQVAANFDRNSHDDTVVGMSPPPPVTRRPPFPFRQRPPPPYKFEVPRPGPAASFFETERPPPPPPPTEVLSPPEPIAEEYFSTSKPKRPPNVAIFDSKNTLSSTTAVPERLNPVIGDSLTVEDSPHKSDAVGAESNAVSNNVNTENPPIALKPDIVALHVDKDHEIISPTEVKRPPIMATWIDSIIVGSESSVTDDSPSKSTEILNGGTTKVLISSGTTTIFGNLFTPSKSVIKPTKTTNRFRTSISILVDPTYDKSSIEKMSTRKNDGKSTDAETKVTRVVDTIETHSPTKILVTHTKTLTVTTTESTVVRSNGKPSTHTVILTKTMTSTVLDTVTEIRTLVRPTSILSTVTTTVSQIATAVVYPTSLIAEEKNDYADANNDRKNEIGPQENDSILVLMTDKNTGEPIVPNYGGEEITDIEGIEESNEVSPNVLLGGIFTKQPSDSGCQPGCDAGRNEVCQKINNIMRCICRPGFARMFPDRPCKPTYTYSLSLPIVKFGKDSVQLLPDFKEMSPDNYQSLIEMTKEGLDRMVMQSELRDIYHGLAVTGFQTQGRGTYRNVQFNIQLSENINETRLEDILKEYLQTSNFSLGGSEIYSSRDKLQQLRAEDYDECTDSNYHDCSKNAHCFNLRGTYTCSCKEGFTDLSQNTLFPGRVCSVLLLILLLIGACLIVLLIVCLMMSCMRRRPHKSNSPLRPPGFRPRPLQSDKRAMISIDTSSEASMDNTPPPYIKQGSRCASRKPSNSTSHSHECIPKKSQSPIRKPSTGALVSAGFEVSATVGRPKEIDDAYATEPHTDLGERAFSTIRTAESSIILDIPPPPTLEAELLDSTKVDLL
ncbi:hypothetical protein AAG570_000786 [Ranatra chinensis]|uniref:Uncharacterized protein n=1 Tax=Ranatra chinensis TaxID=642074 RepID=A0ABD0ZJA8_9HEMI